MEVRLFAHLIDAAGSAICHLEGPHTVQSVIEALCQLYGEPMARLLLNQQGVPLNDDLFVLVNGRHIRQLNGLLTRLESNDVISIVPVIEAG